MQEADFESEADAEGEDDDELVNEETVGAVKIAGANTMSDDGDEDEAAVESSSDAKPSNDSEADSDTSGESDAENEWEAESDGAEEVETEIVDPNRCIFCNEDEEHDPSEEFEEYLACSVCGDNAHRQCARDANSFGNDDEQTPKLWRCPNCIDNGLEADSNGAGPTARRRSSAPKLTRDLLPSHRGQLKPDSHSMFNKLILDDDPMDGSRSLRKRKASDEDELPQRSIRKRQKASTAVSGSDHEAFHSVPSSPEAKRDDTAEAVVAAVLDGANDAESDEDDVVRGRSTRSRRARKSEKQPLAHIVSSEGISLIISFNLDPAKLDRILSMRPKKKRIRNDRPRRPQPAPPAIMEPEVSHYPAIQSTYTSAFHAFSDREDDKNKLKPYGGILTEAEADTTKTFPLPIDRKRFEDARLKAEEDWKQKMAKMTVQEPTRPPPKDSGPPSKIKCINFGGYEINTWHAAPYPEEYSRNKVLYICEFCLKYMNSDFVAWRHKLKCPAKHPPGDEIYRDGKYSFFEVDGRKNPVYCQNLCLLAKLFLGSKTLYYDVEPFLFYIMTETDEFGCHFAGYFSKEKRPSSQNNVSCILVLPIYQRRGFGHMLIDFSYLLTRVEQKTGSPEKPLSDMGLLSYRAYWRLILCHHLLDQNQPLSIVNISERTGMTPDDIVSALEGLRALVRDPITKTYALRLDRKYFKEYIERHDSKNYPKINPDRLVWVPYVMGRGNLANYEEGPPLQTVAPREEDEADLQPEEGVRMAMQKDAATAATTSTTLNGQLDIAHSTLQPNGTSASPSRALSLHRSPSRNNPSTPKTNGLVNGTASPIPPSRFKIFPPLPGQSQSKRRPGRPFGSIRKRSTPDTRRTASMTNGNGHGSGSAMNMGTPTASAPPAGRRTRSSIMLTGEELVNGIEMEDRGKEREEDEEEQDEDEEAEAEGGNENENEEVERDDDAEGEVEAEEREESPDAEGELDEDAEVGAELGVDEDSAMTGMA
ncbi:hypothetical protein K402DRAFT_336955 [Aulographum hederae CBS 113979]|uniref:Histone acetyltransferase n=1 Tax=Aulographum hederae CBS 113979 TaxID=1176131 RepID=A0A6G1GTQ4_9PEZI|nr:hypothetical protein K402DRAFT_336955 [Aulographum hederae CBS 113979]